MRISTHARCIAWFAVLVSQNLPALVCAHSAQPGIHVEILGIRNSAGAVACALFESVEGFPREFLRNAINIVMMKVRAEKAHCDFLDIPPGTYALAVIHDENLDGKLATNLIGLPTEGYGFSNDAKALFGPPSFDAASFSYAVLSLLQPVKTSLRTMLRSDMSFPDSLRSERRRSFYEHHPSIAIAMILIVFFLPFVGLYVSGLLGAGVGVLASAAGYYVTPYAWIKIGARLKRW